MILHKSFATVCDDENICNSCRNSLLNYELDSWLVNDRIHFFRHIFGCGKNSCTESRRRDNRLCYTHNIPSFSLNFLLIMFLYIYYAVSVVYIKNIGR